MASLASFDRKRGAGRPGIAYGEVAWIRKLSGANDSKKLSPEKRAELRARIAEMHAEGKLRAVWAEARCWRFQHTISSERRGWRWPAVSPS